jgi:hypothetical protein
LQTWTREGEGSATQFEAEQTDQTWTLAIESDAVRMTVQTRSISESVDIPDDVLARLLLARGWTVKPPPVSMTVPLDPLRTGSKFRRGTLVYEVVNATEFWIEYVRRGGWIDGIEEPRLVRREEFKRIIQDCTRVEPE